MDTDLIETFRNRRSVTLLLLPVICIISSEVCAQSLQLAPNVDQVVVPPYRDAGVAEGNEIKGATFKLTECKRMAPGDNGPFQVRRGDNRKNRTVAVTAPAAMNVMNARIVNGLIVRALLYAFAKCYAPSFGGMANAQDFSGVRVVVIQRGQTIIETGRVRRTALFREIAVDGIQHHLAERQAAEQRQQEAAERERQRQIAAAQRAEESRHFWQKVKTYFWLLVAVGLIAILFRYGAIIFGYIRYMLSPHPAGSIIARATRREHSAPLNAPAFVESLKYKPFTKTEQRLAANDLRDMTARVEKETEFLNESERLARMAIEMERQRARVDELKKQRSNYD